jgi:hypothetical protein
VVRLSKQGRRRKLPYLEGARAALASSRAVLRMHSGCSVRPSRCVRPKASETVRSEEMLPPPLTVRTDNALKFRFSAMLGEEPEIELALV